MGQIEIESSCWEGNNNVKMGTVDNTEHYS